MSDPRRGTLSGAVAFVALLALHAPRLADAQQSTATTVAEQRARVARLANDLRQADSVLARARAAVTDGAALDTVREGPFFILVEPAHRARTLSAARRAHESLARAYGSAAGSLAVQRVVLRDTRQVRDDGDTVNVLSVAGSTGLLRRLPEGDLDVVEYELLRAGTNAIRSSMDTRLQQWIGTYSTGSAREATFQTAFEDLATTPSPLGRRCLVGDLAACRDALVLHEVDDPLGRWYDRAYHREIARLRRYDLRSDAPARYDACLDGDDAACDALLRSRPGLQVPPPLKHPARHALVAVALERGGPDAFARLLAASGKPIDARLSLAAGMEADSLVAAWRERVLAASPRRAGFPAGTAATTIVWILFFAVLSSRSTRWR